MFKHTERRTSFVTDLTGGVGGICKLIKKFNDDLTGWAEAPKPAHPVIIVIDNDKGANRIYEAISGITKKPKPKGYASFIHVTANLYVVPTPLTGMSGETCIEDFFEKSTLDTQIAGKTFNKAKDIDDTKEYGKSAFALNVVAKNSATINFKGFDELLTRITDAIEHYYASL